MKRCVPTGRHACRWTGPCSSPHCSRKPRASRWGGRGRWGGAKSALNCLSAEDAKQILRVSRGQRKRTRRERKETPMAAAVLSAQEEAIQSGKKTVHGTV